MDRSRRLAAGKMHDGEVETDAGMVRRLLAAQFPRWAGLAIEPVASAGTDNAIYRLGEAMVVRLPRVGWAVGQAQAEHRWLPVLAPHLPLEIPAPLGLGAPGQGFPWPWSVGAWLDGENPTDLADSAQAAADLADFVIALWGIDTAGAPVSGPVNQYRGCPLATRDRLTREAIAAAGDAFDPGLMTRAREHALAAPGWDRPGVWIHGDLQAGNLLARAGRLTGVIDFGLMGVGDPAADLIVGWNLFTGPARARFAAALGVDAAMWARGRGWALSTAVIALPYYRDSNPALAAASRRTLGAVMGEMGTAWD